MTERAEKLSKRPRVAFDGQVDPLSDTIEAMKLSARGIGMFDLVAPFALRLDAREGVELSLLGVLRGSAAVSAGGKAIGVANAGDLIVRTRAEGIELRDSPSSRAPLRALASCPSLEPEPAERTASARFVAIGFQISPIAREGVLHHLPPILIAHPDESPALATAAGMFRLEATAPTAGSRALLARLGEAIFIDILRRSAEREAAGGGAGRCGELRAYADPPLARAIAHVHADPAKPWTLASLGKVAGLSRSAFAARFHAAVGEPALQFITRWRMHRAAELLRETDAAVAAIGRQVGYQSEASFTRTFARTLGKTPGRYRRSA